MNLIPLVILNIGLGLMNIVLFGIERSQGRSGIFQASVSVFNFAAAATIAFTVYTE